MHFADIKRTDRDDLEREEDIEHIIRGQKYGNNDRCLGWEI